MDLDKVVAVVRPRSHWSGVDLGLLLVRQWWPLLIKSWLCLTLPIYLMICLIFYSSYPFVAPLIFWWLLPFWERLLITIMGRALFDDPPQLGASLKGFFQVLKPKCVAYLLWKRLSPTRGFDQSFLILENLTNAQFSNRAITLHRDTFHVALLWLLFCLYLVVVLCYGLLSALYFFAPEAISQHWQRQMFATGDELAFISLLLMSSFYIAVSLVTPFYVGGAFSLYLNRRILLEGWDIEIVFRHLERRTRSEAVGRSALPPLMLFCLLSFLCSVQSTQAIATTQSIVTTGDDGVVDDVQTLSRAQVRTRIDEILEQPPFKKEEVSYHPEFNPFWESWFSDDEEEEVELDLAISDEWGARIGLFFKIVITITFVVMLVYLLLRYLDLKEWLASATKREKEGSAEIDEVHSELIMDQATDETLSAQDLRKIWDSGAHRQALSALYRNIILKAERSGISIRVSETEREVLEKIISNDRLEYQEAEVNRLFRHWYDLAYGHQPLCENEVYPLFDWWELKSKQDRLE